MKCTFAILLSALLSTAHAVTIQVASDSDDGTVTDPSQYGSSSGIAVRVGIGGSAGAGTRRASNAIYFFALPNINSLELDNVDLAFSYLDKGGAGVLNFNLDIWGLGYSNTATLDSGWFFAGNTGGGGGVGIPSAVKIQDNILTPSSGDPNNSNPIRMHTSSSGDSALVSFIQSLYANGATAGDYAIIRLNHDINRNPNAAGTPGYSVGFSENDEPAPLLTFDTSPIPEPATSWPLAMLMGALFLRRRLR